MHQNMFMNQSAKSQTAPSSPSYPFKVWLITIAFYGPFLFFLELITYHDIPGAFQILYIVSLYGLLCSVPTFIIFYFGHKILLSKLLSSSLIKPILAIIATIGIYITLRIINGQALNYLALLFYAVPATLLVFLFPIYPKNNKSSIFADESGKETENNQNKISR